jgi:hypothetical protein
MAALSESDAGDSSDLTKKEPAKKEEPPAKKEPEVTDKKAAAPTPDAASEKPIKAKKKPAPERPALPVATQPAAPAPTQAPAAPTPPPAAPVQKIEDVLNEDELQMLEDSRDLEKLTGAKHAGLSARTEKYLRENQKRLSELKADGIDPETDGDYQAWARANRPSVTARDYEQLRIHRVKEAVSKEPNTELENVKHQLFERDERPKIKQEVDQIYSRLARESMPDEVKTEFDRLSKDHGAPKAWEMVQSSHRLEVEITENVMNAAVADVELFKGLTRTSPSGRPLVKFDEGNPSHMRIHQMIGDTCQAFKELGGQSQVRDGKWFVTRDEWNSLPVDQRQNYWTFSNDELISVAMRGIKPVINKAIEAERKRMEARGFKRIISQQVAPSQPTPPPTPTPSAAAPRPSPIPNTATPNPAVSPSIASLASRLSDQ